jgi:hypothetical protein
MATEVLRPFLVPWENLESDGGSAMFPQVLRPLAAAGHRLRPANTNDPGFGLGN